MSSILPICSQVLIISNNSCFNGNSFIANHPQHTTIKNTLLQIIYNFLCENIILLIMLRDSKLWLGLRDPMKSRTITVDRHHSPDTIMYTGAL